MTLIGPTTSRPSEKSTHSRHQLSPPDPVEQPYPLLIRSSLDTRAHGSSEHLAETCKPVATRPSLTLGSSVFTFPVTQPDHPLHSGLTLPALFSVTDRPSSPLGCSPHLSNSKKKKKKKSMVPGTTMDNSPLLIHVRHTPFSRFTLSPAPPARHQSLPVGPHPSIQRMDCPCTGHSLQPGHLPGLTLNASRFYPIRAPEYKKTMGALPHWYVSFPVYTK